MQIANLRQKTNSGTPSAKITEVLPGKNRLFCKFAASQAVLSPRFIGEESPGNTGRHAS